MSNERLERLETLVEGLSNTVAMLVTEFIRPSAQQAFANFERLERIESALENLVAQSLVNSEQIEANQQQIARNSESITRLETKVDRIADTVSEQSQQIQILIEDNRADRQTVRADREANERRFSEALAAIVSNGNRINALEQRAS